MGLILTNDGFLKLIIKLSKEDSIKKGTNTIYVEDGFLKII